MATTPQKPLHHVKLTYHDGDTTHTSMAGHLSHEDIYAYYKVGSVHNVGIGPHENPKRLVSVEILD